MARELLLWAAAKSGRNNWRSIATDLLPSLGLLATTFLGLKTNGLAATVRSEIACSVPTDVESTYSTEVAATVRSAIACSVPTDVEST